MKLLTRLSGVSTILFWLGISSVVMAEQVTNEVSVDKSAEIEPQTTPKEKIVKTVKKTVEKVDEATDKVEEKLESAVNAKDESAEQTEGKTVESKVNVKVQGIKQSKLNDNVALYLQAMDKGESDGSERHQHLLTETIDKALRVFGYYNSQVSFQLQQTQPKPTLVATVDVGKPVKIEGTDIEITGAAQQDEAFQKLNEQVPTKGTVLEHEPYDNYKGALEKLAQQRGYFDADFPVHQLQVMPSTNQGWWAIKFNSGERYRYGNISFQNSQIEEEYLRNILKIKSGDPYLINDVSEMTNDYSSSNWFQSVMVKPTLHDDTKTVDLDLLMYPKKKNSMELGLGYGTDSGPRGQIGWTRPWINSRGHSLRSNLYVSSPKQTLEFTYKVPKLENPLNYYYEYSLGFESEDDSDTDTKATSATAAALRYWNNEEGWQYSTGVRARFDSFTQADIEEKTWLFYPTATISRTRYSGGTFPTRADNINLTVDLGRKFLLSDVDFFRIRASAGWIKQFATNHRFLTRAEIGYLHTTEFNRIPPALRFFAGGDKSVRGYGYKKISPKDGNGKLLGASRLASATLEYQYQVADGWWWATFVDTGLASNQFKADDLRYGAGMGVRWASPVGAIKFDLATPIRDKDDSKNIQFYIGLGTEL